VVCDNFLPVMGGVSLAIHHLANAFVDLGVETLIVPPPRDGEVAFRQKYKVLRGMRGDWIGIRWWNPNHQRYLHGLLQQILKDFPADAILMGDQAYGPDYSDACLMAAERRGLAVGLCCHGFDIRSIMIQKWNFREIVKWLYGNISGLGPTRQQVLRCMRSADVVFTNSNYTADLVKTAVGRESVVTGCGVADEDLRRELELTPQYSADSKRFWRKQLCLPDKPTIGFVGRLVPCKNVSLIIQVLALRTTLQAVIVGDGFDRPNLEGLANELGVSARVHWVGEVSEELKWQYLRATDVFCLPSHALEDGQVEGFGIVLLEAASAGTPVVGARTGGIPDVIDHGETGLLCDPEDPELLANCTTRLLTDLTLSKRCVDHARQQIANKYNWSHVASTMLDRLDYARGLKVRTN
jgi:glycosyltransferase involved in cell wall biosynthesis